MFSRAVASIVLLTALMAGTISPMAVSALMCEQHSRAGTRHHCGQDADSMPGMAHNHSAMRHSVVLAMTPVVEAQSCMTGCATAEPLNVSRKLVLQVTVVQTAAVTPGKTFKSWARHVESAWSLDGGPPSVPSTYTASYSVLRI